MIDLTGAKIGDKFVCVDRQECELKLKTGCDLCFELLDGSKLLFITNEEGIPLNANFQGLQIVRKAGSDRGLNG